ncbi:hypothetical protein C8R46DRAFT_581202 [Mycena filopes]|nr:hypothetical protein C8R46DRAFT_615309 [Mycena filopes]KAJ7141568.1 hypothetical protein C8R46DRAFT_581202 [Mycena filopes]
MPFISVVAATLQIVIEEAFRAVAAISPVASLVSGELKTDDEHARWEDIKSELGRLTAQAGIATFLSAVQAQIIALSYQDNSTPLRVAVNAVGFAGVLLDVTAACLALQTATAVQRRIAVLERQIDDLIDVAVEQRLNVGRDPLRLPIPTALHRPMLSQFRDRRAKDVQAATEEPNAGVERPSRSQPADEIRGIQRSWLLLRGTASLGQATAIAMGLGVWCFFGSVQCLAIATQPRSVWIVSAVVCGLSGVVLRLASVFQ